MDTNAIRKERGNPTPEEWLAVEVALAIALARAAVYSTPVPRYAVWTLPASLAIPGSWSDPIAEKGLRP